MRVGDEENRLGVGFLQVTYETTVIIAITVIIKETGARLVEVVVVVNDIA